ncbi:MAG: glucose-1-phosphate adenylyltransferase [delta proteobacterium ML8_D]|jgi:glucose-1-phosphate adenylyltransferase|nr:MAG: glucose-1-phosphate adenylyltransferase [delta proteobacterium ML8_D]
MRDTLAVILAGGAGSRLNVLVRHRAKPAVPFGGIYRIIDFALSNVMNSGLNHVAVLTQYKPLSLMDHIGTGVAWDFAGRTRGVKILPPRTGDKDSDWYKGTADAIRQNLDFIETRPSKQVLILSGDHVYYMDYKNMVKCHRATGAKVTVAMMTVPLDQTGQFGIGITDNSGRIVDWEEKPRKAKSNLASMGIYVFDTEYLVESLRATSHVDFGHHILPKAMEEGQLFAYVYHGYWRDVGTVSAYWEANMDLLRHGSGLEPESWSVCTNVENEGLLFDRPPARILPGAAVKNSAISKGCVIRGTVIGSVLSPGVVVENGARVIDSILMQNTWVGSGAFLNKVVTDKEVAIGPDSSIGSGNIDIANRLYPKHLSTGITLIGKWVNVPEGAKIGTNCIIAQRVTNNMWPENLLLPDGETLDGLNK